VCIYTLARKYVRRSFILRAQIKKKMFKQRVSPYFPAHVGSVALLRLTLDELLKPEFELSEQEAYAAFKCVQYRDPAALLKIFANAETPWSAVVPHLTRTDQELITRWLASPTNEYVKSLVTLDCERFREWPFDVGVFRSALNNFNREELVTHTKARHEQGMLVLPFGSPVLSELVHVITDFPSLMRFLDNADGKLMWTWVLANIVPHNRYRRFFVEKIMETGHVQ
jgi:hypothetical protein